MARGDVLSFVMADGSTVELPTDYAMLHDPSGAVIDKCTLVCCACELDAHVDGAVPVQIREYVDAYYGDRAELVKGVVEIPPGPWHLLGVVREILYDRHGQPLENDDDSWFHPYRGSVVDLYVNERGNGYLLVLPAGCVVNERGFVDP